MSDKKPAGSKKKLIIIAAAAIVGLGLTGAGLFAAGVLGGGGHGEHADAGHDGGHGGGHGGHGSGHSTAEEREVDLGEYAVTAYQPDSGATLLISFHLYGTVPHAEEEAFTELFEAHKHRARQHVLVSVRNAEMGDLMDPGLGLIRRQVKHHLNSTFGRPLLAEVVFSDFLITER
jgi:hypothetical protein